LVTFDFPHKTMYLRKGNRYQAVEHAGMSGLSTLREGKITLIYSVASGSQAEIAGLRSGDIILRVDDQDASEIGMFDLRNLFKAGDGKKIRLTISRGGNELEKTLVLKERTPQWAEEAKE
jgi:C-terminal processing protease CtpA/Prc